jgi:hypothetical protein
MISNPNKIVSFNLNFKSPFDLNLKAFQRKKSKEAFQTFNRAKAQYKLPSKSSSKFNGP